MTGTGNDGLQGADNVISLFPKVAANGPSPQETVVANLSRMLELAMEGKVVGLAIVGFTRTEEFIYSAAGEGKYTTFIGGLEELKFQIQLKHMEQSPAKPVT